jgi:hypothetical protein
MQRFLNNIHNLIEEKFVESVQEFLCESLWKNKYQSVLNSMVKDLDEGRAKEVKNNLERHINFLRSALKENSNLSLGKQYPLSNEIFEHLIYLRLKEMGPVKEWPNENFGERVLQSPETLNILDALHIFWSLRDKYKNIKYNQKAREFFTQDPEKFNYYLVDPLDFLSIDKNNKTVNIIPEAKQRDPRSYGLKEYYRYGDYSVFKIEHPHEVDKACWQHPETNKSYFCILTKNFFGGYGGPPYYIVMKNIDENPEVVAALIPNESNLTDALRNSSNSDMIDDATFNEIRPIINKVAPNLEELYEKNKRMSQLTKAISSNNFKETKAFLGNNPKVDLNQKITPRWNPLQLAVNVSDRSPESDKILKILLSKGADPNLTDGGESPLEIALKLTKNNLVPILLKYGANPNQQIKPSNINSLFVAYYLNNEPLKAMDMLLKHKADPFSKNIENESILDRLNNLAADSNVAPTHIQLAKKAIDLIEKYYPKKVNQK